MYVHAAVAKTAVLLSLHTWNCRMIKILTSSCASCHQGVTELAHFSERCVVWDQTKLS